MANVATQKERQQMGLSLRAGHDEGCEFSDRQSRDDVWSTNIRFRSHSREFSNPPIKSNQLWPTIQKLISREN